MSDKREIVNPSSLYNADGFTHAVIPKGEQTVYISGQLPWDENFQIVGKADIAKQTAQAYDNIQAVLDELGAGWDNVAKTTVYTTQPHEHETIARVKQTFIQDVPSPSETLIGVAGLALPQCLIEIEAIVVI